MNKPASMMYEEMKSRMVAAVNESGLPPFIVADVLRGLLAEVDALSRKQLEEDRKAYEQSLGEGEKCES